MSRVSILDAHPENKDKLAIMLANAITHTAIGEEFGVSRDTVGDWKKRPDIQHLVSKYIRERANAILAQTDTAIQKRLEQATQSGKPIPMEVLLRIRQTYAAERPPEGDPEGEKSEALADMLTAIHTNPELAGQLGLEAADPRGD